MRITPKGQMKQEILIFFFLFIQTKQFCTTGLLKCFSSSLNVKSAPTGKCHSGLTRRQNYLKLHAKSKCPPAPSDEKI